MDGVDPNHDPKKGMALRPAYVTNGPLGFAAVQSMRKMMEPALSPRRLVRMVRTEVTGVTAGTVTTTNTARFTSENESDLEARIHPGGM